MSGGLTVIVGFVVLALLTVFVVAFIIRSAIQESHTRPDRMAPEKLDESTDE
ncbi:MAG TPA: hypothetical protein VG815_18450 [Chloroflexota bacterium]|jgi:hypothetical protein|nr:hypothetical protein [Chloroflexota bacterium]